MGARLFFDRTLRALDRFFGAEARTVDWVTAEGGRTFVVRERGGRGRRWRDLVEIGADEMVHTRVACEADDATPGLRSGFAYTDALHAGVFLAGQGVGAVPPEPRVPPAVLCLGGGGGIVARQLDALGAEVDLVELAPEVLAIAATHFGLRPTARLALHCADAAGFLERVARRYDAVLVDLFGAFEAAPALADRAFYAAIRRVLRPGGALAINVVGPLDGGGSALLAARGALARVFGEGIAVPMLAPAERAAGQVAIAEPRNVVLFAVNGGFPRALDVRVPPETTAILPTLEAALGALDLQLRALEAAARAVADGRPLPIRA